MLFSTRKYIFGIYQMNIKCFVCLNKSIIYGLFFIFFFFFSFLQQILQEGVDKVSIKILQKQKKIVLEYGM